ncbi:MAG: DUF3016 domain-containing protein [Verrucomicrobiota bacterium JB022]|nr:DUF3016 domain-containing protein [Verrucomicrobiota bacterium JB022]
MISRVFLLLGALCPAAWGAQALEVSIPEAKEFRDFTLRGQTEENTAIVFEKNLHRYWDNYVADEWPEGYALDLEFTEIDLGGEMAMGNPDERSGNFPPFIRLQYELRGPDGEVVKEGKKSLREATATTLRARRIGTDMVFRYEFAMIHEWLENDLLKQIKKDRA